MLAAVECQSCGAACPPDARFCWSCGHPIGAHLEERRVVTVLFADLVGFTTLSETLDPEHVKRIVDRAFERLVRDVNTFGGRVDKIIGDAIVALFGAPIAHEDDAERAVRAALRMQATLASYATEVGVDVRMRVGVNTGEVLVGALRAGGDYTAMGDVVNTASRLQTSADPGTVVVGEATHHATSDVISYESCGALFARGRDQPVNVWRATAAVVPPGYRPRRTHSPLIGRDAELLILDNLVEVSIRNGRHQLILLLGDAGVGKSRLANEVAPLVLRHHPEATELSGRCVPYGEANPWWPIADAVRDGCGLELDASLDEARERTTSAVSAVLGDDARVVSVTNGLLHLMGYEGPLRGLDPSRARGEATQSLLVFMEAMVRERPVVLRIADLHWADDMVLETLQNLSNEMARYPFVLVATARRSLLRRWTPGAGRFNSLVVNVDPLDREPLEQLLDVLLTGDLDPGLREILLDRSGGNPFYLEELVTLTEGRSVSIGAGVDLPDTLRGLVSARIDGLTAEEQLTLEDAAVWGSEGPLEALRKIAEAMRGVKDVSRVVTQLESKEVLNFDGSEWSFRSDLVREVAYSRLTKTDRLRRHLGIATYLEMAVEGRFIDDSFVETVARHYLEATRLAREMSEVEVPDDLCERAIRWVGEAARRAEQSASWPLAERLYSQGIELAVDDLYEAARLPMLLGRSQVRCEQWDFVGARSDAHAALELAERRDDASATAYALTKLGETAARESTGEGDPEVLDRAVRIFEELGDRHGRAEALRWSGMSALLRNDHEAAKVPIEASLEDYRALGDHRGEAWALQNLAWIAFVRGNIVEAEARLDESAKTFSEIGDNGGLAWAMGLLAFVRLSEGRFTEARELAGPIMRETERRGDHWGQGMMAVILGSIDLWEGSTEDAVRTADRAIEAFGTLGDSVGSEQAYALGGRAHVMAGKVGAGLNLLERAVGSTPGGAPGPDNVGLGVVSSLSARVHLGDPALWADLHWLVDHARSLAHDRFGQIDLAVTAGLASAMEGDVDGGLATVAHVPQVASSGYALAVSALVSAAAGRVDEAVASAEALADAARATYLDRVMAGVALGLTGRADGFRLAREAVEPTGDHLARAILALAEGIGAGDRAVADAAWVELGVEPVGWVRIMEAAVAAAAGLAPAR